MFSLRGRTESESLIVLYVQTRYSELLSCSISLFGFSHSKAIVCWLFSGSLVLFFFSTQQCECWSNKSPPRCSGRHVTKKKSKNKSCPKNAFDLRSCLLIIINEHMRRSHFKVHDDNMVSLWKLSVDAVPFICPH